MAYFYHGAPDWFFSAMSFLGFLLSMIPLPWHLEAWNVGTCLYMIWTGLACLIFFINSIIWKDNIIDWSPRWCDFSTHFLIGFNLAIPACSLCINRRLYQIASVSSVRKTRTEQRRAIYIDIAIALGLPILQIPLQYVVQGHRYNIFEDVGCLGETFETPVSIVLYHLPPVIVGLVSAVYCVLSIRAFYRSRAQFKEFLSSNNNLNLNRYLRLMCLASTDLLLTVPSAIWVLWVTTHILGISKWVSWEDTHSNFSRVWEFPGIIWRANVYTAASLETQRWATVACAFIFFGYFGFADEAIKNYRFAFFSVAKRMGYSTATMSSSGSAGVLSSNGPSKPNMSTSGRSATLPVFVRKETAHKHDSLASFSDLSASFGGLDYAYPADGEKSFGTLSVTLPDYKDSASVSELSPTDSDASSSGGPSTRPHTPVHAGEEDAEDIEVSSLHRASMYIPPPPSAPAPTPPPPAVPAPAHIRDAADMV